MTTQDDELTRRVYAYFVYRLRQPAEAERLTRRTFEFLWQESAMGREDREQPELATFVAARAVMAESPRARGATRVSRPAAPEGLGDEFALALGRLHGRERDALALRFGAELSIGEIAVLLDRTPADVKQRLARAIRGLIGLGLLPKDDGGSAAKRAGAGGTEQGEPEQDQS